MSKQHLEFYVRIMLGSLKAIFVYLKFFFPLFFVQEKTKDEIESAVDI